MKLKETGMKGKFIISVILHYNMRQGATDMIICIGIGRYIGIGRFIGIADMRNAYRYRLSVSADKKSYIGSLTDIL